MTGDRIRVLPAFDPRGTVVFHGFVGALLALPAWLFGSLGLTLSGLALTCLAPITELAIPIVAAAVLASHCQRKRIAFWSGLTFGACNVSSWMLSIALARYGLIAGTMTQEMLGWLMVIVVVAGTGLVYGLGFVAVNWLFRQCIYRIQDQDGSLCWTCAYAVGNPPISPRCPECGAPIHPPITRPGPYASIRCALKRRARIMAAVAVVGVVAIFVTRTLDQYQALSALRAGVAGTATYGAVMKINRLATPPTWVGAWEAGGLWRAIPSDPSKALTILYIPNSTGNQPAMQIQLMGLYGKGSSAYTSWGNPAISCDLSREQAAFVIKNDVPQSLIDAMLQEASKAKWIPLPAGGTVSCVDVSPEGHFADEQK